MRLMLPGGAHFAFTRVGQGLALWKTGLFSEAVGASGGSIPAALITAGLSDKLAVSVSRSFRMSEVCDVPQHLQNKRLLAKIGAGLGQNIAGQIKPVLDALGVETWSDFRHETGTAPQGTKRSHRLGIQVCVLSVHGMSLDQARSMVGNGRFLRYLTKEVLRGHRPTTLTLPEDAEKIGRRFSADFESRPVTEAIADSIRHPFAFSPRIWKEPGVDRIDFIFDGALPPQWTANPWNKEIPEVPTTVALFGRDQRNPKAQAKADIREFPGYRVLRYPTPDLTRPDLVPRCSRVRVSRPHVPAFLHTPRFDLTAEQQIGLMQLGVTQTAEVLAESSTADYLERWSELRLREASRAYASTERSPSVVAELADDFSHVPLAARAVERSLTGRSPRAGSLELGLER